MSTMEPDPLEGLDFDVEEPTVVNLTAISDFELANLDADTQLELKKMNEMFVPPEQRSERGKELHSTLTAIQVERQRRLN